VKNIFHKRVAKNLLAKVILPSTEFFGFIMDLSTYGLGFTCNRSLPVGEQLQISLNVPQRRNMKLTGAVTWNRTLPATSKNRFQYGVKLFSKPNDYDEYVHKLFIKENLRRKHPRYREVLEVKNDDVLELMDAATQDISEEGFYIRTGRPLTVGQKYDMALTTSEFDKPMQCKVEVVAVFNCEPDGFDHPYGAGVRILSFDGDSGDRFAMYIRNLEKLYNFPSPDQVKGQKYNQPFA